jgi:uncharacterized protein YdeI (YjbR/CyaY-like superfamily)
MNKLTTKQLAKWLNSLPETMNVWELNDEAHTIQQVNAALSKHDAARQVAVKLNEELRAIDSLLTACAENDAAENMPSELNDSNMLGYWASYYGHLINAAQCHWEGAGRDLNADLGRVVC